MLDMPDGKFLYELVLVISPGTHIRDTYDHIRS